MWVILIFLQTPLSYHLLNSLNSIFYHIYIYIYIFVGEGVTGVWTQGLHLEALHQPCDSFLKIGSCELFAWGWFWTVILLIPASWVARMTGVGHQPIQLVQTPKHCKVKSIGCGPLLCGEMFGESCFGDGTEDEDSRKYVGESSHGAGGCNSVVQHFP
jgi:hypothetical protein